MNPNWTPPRDVIQLTYYVDAIEFKKLSILQTKEEGYMIISRVRCGKQADRNAAKWDPTKCTIVNFVHKDMHIYVKLIKLWRTYKEDFGIGYRILTSVISELPK